MVLIVISWIYILFTTINLGFLTDKILQLKNKNFVITSILGLFSVTILASIWAIFGRINIEFHALLLLTNILLYIRFQKSITEHYTAFWIELKQLNKALKVFLIILFFLILAQCASIPFVIDNESYYIQTIKWLNEYGFVKGLANLHLFLGQTSGWHVTQSAFNFSFLYQNFNDLSGFCLLLGNLFAIQKLNDYFKNNNSNYLIIGLFPLFNILFFQFISAPSPDIPVYVFSFIFFFYFLENFKKLTPETFNLLVILALFLFYIKNTTVTFFVFPIILLLFHFKSIFKELLKPALLSIILISLFIVKNLIVSGTVAFPSNLFGSINMDYAIPNSIQSFYYEQIKCYGYFVTPEKYNSMSAGDLFLRWITMSKLNGLFNKISVLLILITPFLILKFKNEKAHWSIYFVMVIQLILLLITSPQYRFFLNYILFFSLFCLICMIKNNRVINILIMLSLIPVVIVLFFSINLSKFANNNSLMEISNFSSQNIIFPFSNSKNSITFETIRIGNLKYNSPQNNDFFWGNGNGDLPCINKVQIEYFEKYFHYRPQMRTNNLKDGFYSKEITKNE
ncbi:LIC_10190 family membrane protein [Flavobacterium notoginsengisoli]|uniref:LIC_10190 family membrane protein n=1 Tax=Flavobacterium notoginsengisoli TaxID=1478199 RepID=UPI00362E097F